MQAHRDWSGDNLAERLDITSRTVRRDIDRPHELGHPVTTVEGPADGYACSVHPTRVLNGNADPTAENSQTGSGASLPAPSQPVKLSSMTPVRGACQAASSHRRP
ncbi:HTH domain-containing protein [Streptomyces atroolivaceus]|uniref:HTH domain-containing protein n=1 Tax=Streptomyces atroolivaceus TaxID=66869 RepID=UPI00363129AA